MNPPAVNDEAALQKMIADLSEITISEDCADLGPMQSRSIFKKLQLRISSEPARVQTDTEGRIISVNPAFIQLCGHDFEDLKGRKPGSILQGPQSSHESIKILRNAIRNRIPCTTEIVNYHKDRTPYRVRVHLRPLFSESGELTGFEAEERQVR
ncbi:MAG: PAS domain-containing protein [Terrimicrobiaceae bacterium]